MQRVAVVGLGYMGLPTALLLARDAALRVVGHDVAADKLERLRRGVLPFDEPGLPELFAETGARLELVDAMPEADAFVLALPTPLRADRGCDLRALDAAARDLAPVLRGGELVIVESTVSPGTTLRLWRKLQADTGLELDFAYVSEKAIPGDTLREMTDNDRIIGATSERARRKAGALYAGFVRGELVFTDPTSAEAAKLFENTYRDVNIALANELAEVSEHHGIDVHEVIDLANRHPRVNILRPGPGVGGHCIAIDPWFLIEGLGESAGEGTAPGALIRTGRAINDARPARVAAHVQALLGAPPGKVALLGTAYKADVDDDRESPSYAVARALEAAGYTVALHDPHVRRAGVTRDLAVALSDAAGAVLLTDHAVYAELDLRAWLAPGSAVLDARGLWRRRDLAAQGYRYRLLGGRAAG